MSSLGQEEVIDRCKRTICLLSVTSGHVPEFLPGNEWRNGSRSPGMFWFCCICSSVSGVEGCKDEKQIKQGRQEE